MDPYPCNRVIANVLFKTSYLESWGKYEKLLHKNKCTTKSHSWRFGPQRAETFSRVAELRFISCYHQASVFQNAYWSSHDFICFGYAFLALSI